MTGKPEPLREEPTRELEEGGALCPHCLEPVDDLDHFCPACAKPITSHAAIDPLGHVYAAGHVYRQATESPRLITVIGIWLIFGLQVPFLLLALVGFGTRLVVPGMRSGGMNVSFKDGMLALITIVVLIASAGLYSAIVWTVTRAYRRGRRWEDRRCMRCNYDLRGTIAAGKVRCPECGWAIPMEEDAGAESGGDERV